MERASTSDLVLRDVREDDLPALFEHQDDPEANRMAAFPARDRDSFMAHWAKIIGDETVTAKAVVLDGEVAGNVSCFEQSGDLLVGYWIGREYWGRGVATWALSEFLGVVTERPLRAHVATSNRASIRVLEKCGFTLAGEPTTGDDGVEEIVLELRAGPD